MSPTKVIRIIVCLVDGNDYIGNRVYAFDLIVITVCLCSLLFKSFADMHDKQNNTRERFEKTPQYDENGRQRQGARAFARSQENYSEREAQKKTELQQKKWNIKVVWTRKEQPKAKS